MDLGTKGSSDLRSVVASGRGDVQAAVDDPWNGWGSMVASSGEVVVDQPGALLGQDAPDFRDIPLDPHHGLPPWKRTLDIVLGGAAFVALLPLMALVALGIKCISPGPVVFRQERVGYRGRRFECIKFRSMRTESSTETHRAYLEELVQSDRPMAKLDRAKDPRVIPFGRLMRALAIDELPQLINVFRGEMSLVGPRPAIPYEYERYRPEHRMRFLGVPGMTGLWQVNGKNHTTFAEMVEMDVQYAAKKTLGLDVTILLRTPKVLVEQMLELLRGAPEERES